MTDFLRLLRILSDAAVEFIVIGGFAATAHGSAHVTVVLDVVYRRSAGNMDRLVDALRPLRPYLRGAPPGLPFQFDMDTLLRGLNFPLNTTAGDLDLLGEAVGGGTLRCPAAVFRVAPAFGSRMPLRQARDAHPSEARCRTPQRSRTDCRTGGHSNESADPANTPNNDDRAYFVSGGGAAVLHGVALNFEPSGSSLNCVLV